MSGNWWTKYTNVAGKRSGKPIRRERSSARLWLERLEDRLAPASFDYSGGTLSLNTTAAGATADVYKSGPNQVQIVLGAAGDVWHGTDGAASGITGNGLTTLTVDTSLYTGAIDINYGGSGHTIPDTLTFHGMGASGSYPEFSANWGGGDVGNIVFTGGIVALGMGSNFVATGAISVNSPITSSGNLVLQAIGDLTVSAPITSGVGDNITLRGANVAVNAALQTAPITSPDELSNGYGVTGSISITASVNGTLDLNAPVSTGQVGSLDDSIGPEHGGATGNITVSAGTIVGNAQAELSTGSTYAVGFGTGYYAPQSSGSISITSGGDITLAAPVAASTGDAIDFRDPVTEAGGYPTAGEIFLQLSGTISADGASAPANLHFGLVEGAAYDSNNNPTTGPEPIVGSGDLLALASPGGAYGLGTGNIYLACTGAVRVDMESLAPHASAHQTIDIATTGDLLAVPGFNSGPAQLAGDDISLGTSGGILNLILNPNAAGLSVDLGTGNLTLTADEINITSGYYTGLGQANDFSAPDAIEGTGSVLLQPATPGRNIAIGGDNTLANALNLSDNDLSDFAPGFKSFTIGRVDDGTGTVDILDNQAFDSPTSIYGGNFTGQGVTALATSGTNTVSEWANRVLGFSSQYEDDNFPYFANPASSALGQPDTIAYGTYATAWAPASQNGTQDYLELGYLQPVYATGVTIQESDGNGFVYQVDLVDTNGNLHTVFTGPDNTLPGAPAGLDVPIAQTSYLVEGVKVYVNTNHDLNNWEEIDAVQLRGVTPNNDLTLHAHTGSIGGTASTTSVYNTNQPGPGTSIFTDLTCFLPAESQYSAQIDYVAGIFHFALLVDGIQIQEQDFGGPGNVSGTVDFEVDLSPLDYAPLPVLHEVTVKLLAGNGEGAFVRQAVTTTIPGGGGASAPLHATAGGTLNLITDAGNGSGNIYVLTGHSLTLLQNALVSTGPGRHTISLQTSAGDITVPVSYPNVLANDIYLNAAGSVNLAAGLSLTAPVLSFVAAAAVNLDPTQLYTTTVGDLTFQSGTGSIGTAAAPIQVRVAGRLNLSISGGSAFVTSAGPLGLGNIDVADDLGVTTTTSDLTLVGNGQVNGTATLISAGSFVDEGLFDADSLTVTAPGSITGGGLAAGNMTLDAGTFIGTSAAVPFYVYGATLNAVATGGIYITSVYLTVASISTTPGQTVAITTTGGGVLTTLFSAGLFGDTVTLDGGTGGLIMHLPTGSPLDFGNVTLTLIGDAMTLDGPAGSLRSTGPLLVQSKSANQPITLGGSGGPGLYLTTDSVNALAPGFSSITIGRTDFSNPVSIGGDVTFTSPTTIIGSSFADTVQKTLATSGVLPLTLHALTGAIGAPGASVLVNVGGMLTLTADAAAGAADVYVTSAHDLTLGQNVTVTTGSGRDTVFLATNAGDITVPASFTTSDDWTLQSFRNITVQDNVTLTAASLILNVGGALATGHSTLLRTTLADLSLTSAGASIGTSTQPVYVRVAGKLNVTTTAASLGSANAFVSSAFALPVGNLSTGVAGSIVNIATTASDISLAVAETLNGFVTLNSAAAVHLSYVGTFQAGAVTVEANNPIVADSTVVALATSAGGLTLSASLTGSDDLTLQSAGDLTIANGAQVMAKSLALIVGGTLVTGPSTLLRTTLTDLSLTSAGASLGTSSQPVHVRVAGKLNVTTAAASLGSADAFVTSAFALVVGNLSTSAAGSAVKITTTAGGITLGAAITLNALVTLNSAGQVGLSYTGSFQAHAVTITAAGTIAGNGTLVSDTFMTLTTGGDIGTVSAALLVKVGSTLSASATGSIFITSPQHDLQVGTLASTRGPNVSVSTNGGGVLQTLFSAGLTGDNVKLDGGSGGLLMELPAGAALDFGNGVVTLLGDHMTLNGPAGSLEGTGPLSVETDTAGLAITLGGGSGGAGLDLTISDLGVFAPGFRSFTIGQVSGNNPVTTAGPVSFGCPTTIVGTSISDASGDSDESNIITTTNSKNLTLIATSGNINVNVNVGGNLFLTADAVGSINVLATQPATNPLALGTNTVINDQPGEQVVLKTTAAGISVATQYSGTDNLSLSSAEDITIDNGATLTEASLTLNADGALVTDQNTDLVAESGDMSLTCFSGGVGAIGTPLNVTVAGTLTVTSGTTDPVQISSPASLTLGKIETGHGATVLITSGGDLALSEGNLLFGQVALEAGAQFLLGDGDPFQAGSLIVLAQNGISGSRPLQANAAAFANGVSGAFLVHNVSGDVGSASKPVEIDSLAGGSASIQCNNGNVYLRTSGTLHVNSVSAGSGATATFAGGNYVADSQTAFVGNVALLLGSSVDVGAYVFNVNQLTVDQATIVNSGGGSMTGTAGTVLLSGNISGLTGDTTKQGAGTVTITGNNPNAGVMTATAGTVAIATNANYVGTIETSGTGSAVIDGNATVVAVDGGSANITPTAQVGTVAVLNGNGTIDGTVNGNVTVGGTSSNSNDTANVAGSGFIQGVLSSGSPSFGGTAVSMFAGDDPGRLTVGGLDINAACKFIVNIWGPVAGSPTGYGQFLVNGMVTLAGSTLKVDLAGYQPPVGQQFIIIDNEGGDPINGIFNGLPEGTVFAVGNTEFQISYQGGNGQSVALTVVAGTPPTITGVTPSLAGDTLPAGTTSLQVTFNEPVVGADQPTKYQLQGAGPDALLGTTDDVTVPITSATISGNTATLSFPALDQGLYRLRVLSTIVDGNGVPLAGDGIPGDDYVVDFVATFSTADIFNSPNVIFNTLTSKLGAGELVGNPTAGYEVLSHLQVGGADFAPTGPSTFGGGSQDLITATQTMVGLNVGREVTVPTGGSQDFARTVETLENPTNSDITTTVTLISNLGTASSVHVFATSSGDAAPSVNDQWVGIQAPGGPAIIEYIHGPAGRTPTAVNVTGDGIEWTYSITVPAGRTVEFGEFSILNGTQAGASAAASALVTSIGFGGRAGDFLNSTELAALANFQFFAAPSACAGGPYTLKEGSALTFDASNSSDSAGLPLNYSWTINGVADAATGANPTLTYAQLQALGINLGGTYDISVAVDDGHGGTDSASTSLTVVVGNPVKLAFEPSSHDATAGHTIPAFHVDVLDQLGGLANSDTSTVTVAITAPNGATFSAGTLSVAASGGVATFSDLVIRQAGTYTLTASDGNLTHAVSATFTISADVADHLAFANTSNDASAGATIPTFLVDVVDRYGNLVADDASTVTVAINSGPRDGDFAGGTLSAAAVAGVAAFDDLVLQTAGRYTLVATDNDLGQAISGDFAIGNAAANSLSFEDTNNNAASGQTIPAFKVDVRDQYGNLVTDDTSTVTISLNSDPPDQDFASGTLDATAIAGIATFNDLVIQQIGAYSLTASDGFLAPAFSNGFEIIAGLAVTSQPHDQTLFAGQTTTFTAASADSSDTVQWQVNQNDGHGFTDINGATATTLTISNVTPSENGNTYRAVFSSSSYAGSLASSAAALTVDFVNVASNPADETINVGQSATFSAAAAANPGARVQWQVNKNDGNGFTDISGATSATLSLNGVAGAMNGFQYEAVFATTGVNSTTITATTMPATLNVHRVAATITITPYSGAYDGAAHGISGIATGVFIDDVSNLLDLGSVFLQPGHHVVNWSFAGDSNYLPSGGTSTIDISRANPSVTWSNPADITFGTALDATQLNATANVPGTFSYTPVSGAVLNAGQNQALNVEFTPGDTIDYNSATDSVVITVRRATPTFSDMSAPTITYGAASTAVSGHLNANANGQPVSAGETVQVTLNGVVHDAALDASDDFSMTFDTSGLGVAGSPYTINFSYGGDANFNNASDSSTLTVRQASQSITFDAASPITYTAVPILLSATGGGSTSPVTFSIVSGPGSLDGNALTITGIGSIVIEADQASDVNYTASPPVQRTILITTTFQGTATQVENATPVAATVTSILGTHDSDPDGSANTKRGIAVIQTDGIGTWQYSTNGMKWTAMGVVTPTQALLLPGSDSVRFLPATNTSGVANLYFVAWDGSQGKAGAVMNTIPGDDTTPFSANAGALTVTVNPVPTWIGTGAHLDPILPGIYSTSNTTPAGNTVNAIFGPLFHDDDPAASVGVAITTLAGTANGTWQYSTTDHATWSNFPPVSAASALLLSANDWIRFVPKDNFAGVVASALAWDGSSTTHGTLVNLAKLPSSGFSKASLTARQSIAGNPPSWTAATGAGLTPLLPGAYSTTNATTPPGDSVASVFGGFFQDIDPSVTVGIAVVGLAGNGSWQYSTTTGTWLNFMATPSNANATLLSATDLIRFVPKTTAAGTATLTAYAWDGSVGMHGSNINLTKTGLGGVSGFSTTTLVATAPANRAPDLSVANINEPSIATSTTSAAITVSNLLTQAGYSDPDGAILPRGIAIVGAATTASVGQYLLPGGTWQALPNVAPSAALLLPSTASVKFVANNQIGSATLTFEGWDETQGVAGRTFNIAASGGATAFSNRSSILSILVKQAPSWTSAAGASLTPLLPGAYSATNATTPAGDRVASVFGGFFHDIDPSVTIGIAVVGLVGNGTWQYATTAGTWLSFTPTLSNANATLLSATELIRFVPKTTAAGTATLTAYAWDGSVGMHGTNINLTKTGLGSVSGFSTKTLTAACVVNTAPVLMTPNVTLSPINENASSAAISAASLLTKAGYADTDGKAIPSGIAVIGDTGSGAWQWFNGTAWTALPAVPSNAAFLLPSASQIRFQPANNLPVNNNGSATLTYFGWDETAGTANQVNNLTGQGGTFPFSTDAATATMAVNFFKQAPAWTPGVSAAFTPVLGFSAGNPTPSSAGDTVSTVFSNAFADAPGVSVGVAITALGGATVGTWQYLTDSSATWTNMPTVSSTNAFLLSANARLRFVPSKSFSGTVTLTAFAWDGTGNFSGTANLVKSGNGGATPFSGTALTATCLINTAPSLSR